MLGSGKSGTLSIVENKGNEHHFDVQVFDAKGDDVTEGMVVQTLIGEILEEV